MSDFIPPSMSIQPSLCDVIRNAHVSMKSKGAAFAGTISEQAGTLTEQAGMLSEHAGMITELQEHTGVPVAQSSAVEAPADAPEGNTTGGSTSGGAQRKYKNSRPYI